ncbi:PRC-barrel domain-containing protein [Rufibacter roseolus]|uniref:PRC-barrel domain-containing protein n=1 Tax=Rufibacter roseolus TaxID=2817375 RepID=UPI001B30FB11|nr:PRC and DUF2382 domain-containing protein [Rufibacter roseolus]
MERRDQPASNYHLKELGDSRFTVAKGDSDIRGWKVNDSTGNILGKVKDLLCDPQALKVRYLIVDLEGNVLDLESRDILIPIGLAELHEADDVVMVPSISPAQLQALPTYDKHNLTQEIERAVQRIFVGDHVHGTSPARHPETTDFYSNEHFNQNNLYRNRKPKNVIGLFPDAVSAQRVTQELFHSGFPEEAVEVAYRHGEGNQQGDSSPNFEQFFHSLFASPEEARAHEAKMQNSHALVVVHAYSQDEANRAAHLLDSPPTSELDIQVERASPASPLTDGALEQSPARAYSQDATTIPVVEDKSHLDKQEVGTGQTHSHRVERPLEEKMQQQEEHIQIERIPVDRSATEVDFRSFQDGVIELKEYGEVPIISKVANVVEEITIGKDVEIREEIIQDTVKKTEIQIEDLRNDNPRTNPPGNSHF